MMVASGPPWEVVLFRSLEPGSGSCDVAYGLARAGHGGMKSMRLLPSVPTGLMLSLFLGGCAVAATQPTHYPDAPSAPSSTPPASAGVPSTGPPLQGFCRPEAVETLADALADAVTAGNSAAIPEQFAKGVVHWDVYSTQPAGGLLQAPEDIREFVTRLHADGVRWHVVEVYPPTGDDLLPDYAVYGASISIEDSGGTRSSPMKLVVDCNNGGIDRAAGPEG